MEQAGMHVLKLNIGNPATFGFRAVDEVVHDMSLQLPIAKGILDSKGLWSARKGHHAVLPAQGVCPTSRWRTSYGQRRFGAHQHLHVGAPR